MDSLNSLTGCSFLLQWFDQSQQNQVDTWLMTGFLSWVAMSLHEKNFINKKLDLDDQTST